MEDAARILESADVDDSARVGAGTTVWHVAQVRDAAQIGEECVIGRGAYVDAGVVLGRACKIQNYAMVYAPAHLEEGVFVGPATVLTNDTYPRAIEPDGHLKGGEDWDPHGVHVARGASVGAGAVVLAGLSIGTWAMVAAGAVVTAPVPDYGLVVGSPARRVGWVGPAGVPLESNGKAWRCPVEGRRFIQDGETLQEQP
jgi:acetyltransferase-like isoleucine patch superfamily enzyme